VCATVLGQAPPPAGVVERRRAELPTHRDYRVYLARIDGAVAGLGTLFFHGRAAYLAGAMTLPEMRRRGCQRALLEHRIRQAAERGCDLVVTDTLGDNESQRNVERAGLRPRCWPGWWVRPIAGAPAQTAPRL